VDAPKNILCPYCVQIPTLVTGKTVYPHRKDLHSKYFYYCDNGHDAAYVGCHPNTLTPLGRLADATLRKLKMAAHAAFDPIWKDGRLSRGQAYEWLSFNMGLPKELTHIGMFDEEQCQRVIKLCKDSHNGQNK
jgi:hypothetical protein